MVASGARTRTATLLALAAVSALCAILLTGGTLGYKWPPDVNPLRPVVALLALASLMSALVASRSATSVLSRAMSFVLSVLASGCYLFALYG